MIIAFQNPLSFVNAPKSTVDFSAWCMTVTAKIEL